MAALAACLLVRTPGGACADVLHLTSGGSLEGKVLQSDSQQYTLLTGLGTVTLPADAVLRIEHKPGVLDEYEQRRRQTLDQDEAHFALAAWCAEQGLPYQRRQHLLRTIELNPDHAAARAALGYVRQDGRWIRPHREPSPPDRGTAPEEETDSGADERLVRSIQGQWARRVRAIRITLLESDSPQRREEGRRRIRQIDDPLAIVPLARELSQGPASVRSLLVEVLTRFPGDDAALNLAAMAIADESPDIRRRVLSELARRDDPRLAALFRRALRAPSETAVRRAAEALGALRARSAVPDLIEALTAPARLPVELPATGAGYFGDLRAVYPVPLGVRLGHGVYYYAPQVAIASGSVPISPQPEYAIRDVTVLRTEVLEALKAITGENFGFDQSRWRAWFEEQHP